MNNELKAIVNIGGSYETGKFLRCMFLVAFWGVDAAQNLAKYMR